MSAEQVKPKAKRAPTFYTEVEVDVDPYELERAGWRYVGKDADGKSVESDDEETTVEEVAEVVMEWHRDAHDMPWQWCSEEPCDSMRRLLP